MPQWIKKSQKPSQKSLRYFYFQLGFQIICFYYTKFNFTGIPLWVYSLVMSSCQIRKSKNVITLMNTKCILFYALTLELRFTKAPNQFTCRSTCFSKVFKISLFSLILLGLWIKLWYEHLRDTASFHIRPIIYVTIHRLHALNECRTSNYTNIYGYIHFYDLFLSKLHLVLISISYLKFFSGVIPLLEKKLNIVLHFTFLLQTS